MFAMYIIISIKKNVFYVYNNLTFSCLAKAHNGSFYSITSMNFNGFHILKDFKIMSSNQMNGT